MKKDETQYRDAKQVPSLGGFWNALSLPRNIPQRAVIFLRCFAV